MRNEDLHQQVCDLSKGTETVLREARTLPLDGSRPRKKRTFSTAAMAAVKVGTVPGAASSVRSMALGSSCVRQMPARSPCWQRPTGCRNTWMLFTFFTTLASGSSTIPPTCNPVNLFLNVGVYRHHSVSNPICLFPEQSPLQIGITEDSRSVKQHLTTHAA